MLLTSWKKSLSKKTYSPENLLLGFFVYSERMAAFYTSVVRYGNSLLYSGYDENGIRVREKIKFKPTLYIAGSSKEGWKALDETPVDAVTFDSMAAAKEFREMYKDVPSFKVHGMERWIFQFIQSRFPNEITYNRNLINVLSIDIETYSGNGFPFPEEAKEEITLISIKASRSNKRVMWGCRPYDPEQSEHEYRRDIEYRQFRSEPEMLVNFVEWISHPDNTPDVITGWNIRTYDIPYILNRIAQVCGEEFALRISPWNKVDQRSVMIKGKPMQTYEIAGISQLDYLDLFMKFGNQGPQESYKLGHIAYVVLGDAKLSYDEYDSLHDLYERNFQKYADYCLKDTDLIDRFEAKLGLINLAVSFAYMAGVNYNDTLGTVALWDAIIFRALALKKIAVPPGEESEGDTFEGGYVKEPQIGKYGWVCSLDLDSLYPNIIVQYNMSPETFLNIEAQTSIDAITRGEKPICERDDVAITANGACFRRDKQGILPELISTMYAGRVEAKNKMLDAKKQKEKLDKGDTAAHAAIDVEISKWSNKQMALKLALNSVYGASGSRYFRYYNLKIAEGVTLTGQLTIQLTSNTINSFMERMISGKKIDYILMNDTDSASVLMQPVVDYFKPKDPAEFLAEYVKKGILPELGKAYEKLCALLNGYQLRMGIKLENVASSAVFLAKKKYMMYVISSEGVKYKEPKLKIVGVAAIQSSTPECCRKVLKETIKLILVGTELQVQDKIAEFRKAFGNFSPEEVAFPRGVSDLKTYASKENIYKRKEELRSVNKKSVPINSRAALLYNHHIKKNGLDKKYNQIFGGDKIKYLYLLVPNPIREDVFGFIDILPKELSLHKYVDYDTQFEKAFLSLIVQILEVIGWKPEKVETIDDFFS